jgi:hypothetical protein
MEQESGQKHPSIALKYYTSRNAGVLSRISDFIASLAPPILPANSTLTTSLEKASADSNRNTTTQHPGRVSEPRTEHQGPLIWSS